jgi:hypothetical protein
LQLPGSQAQDREASSARHGHCGFETTGIDQDR